MEGKEIEELRERIKDRIVYARAWDPYGKYCDYLTQRLLFLDRPITNEERALLLETAMDVDITGKKYDILAEKLDDYRIDKDDDFIVIKENKEELKDEELAKIFKEFGFSVEQIEKINKTKGYLELKKYGNYENIKGILAVFKKFNLGPNVFRENERRLFIILINSNVDIVNKIIENIEQDIIEYERISSKNEKFYSLLKYYFIKHFECVTIFGKNNSVYEELRPSTKKSPSGKGDEKEENKYNFFGRNNRYEKNREFLKSIGINHLKIISTLIDNPLLIKYNIDILKKYGYTIDEINKGPSVISQNDLASRLDLAIELNLMTQAKTYPTTLLFLSELVVSRIKYCRLHNIPINGRTVDDISSRIKLNHYCFDDSKEPCGPEIKDYDGEIPADKIVFDSRENYKNMINNYRKLMHLKLLESKKVSYPDVLSSALDGDLIKGNYTYQKAYFQNLINDFDRVFAFGKLTYVFTSEEGKVIISRYKVLRNLSLLLQGNISNETFDNFSEILLNCLTSNSILTDTEYEIIRSNVYKFINDKNALYQSGANYTANLDKNRINM